MELCLIHDYVEIAKFRDHSWSLAIGHGSEVSTNIGTDFNVYTYKTDHWQCCFIGLTSCKDIFFIKASSKQRCILLFTSLSRSVSLLPAIRCISLKGVATILLAGDRTPWGEPGVLAEGSWSGSEWSALRTLKFNFHYTGDLLHMETWDNMVSNSMVTMGMEL